MVIEKLLRGRTATACSGRRRRQRRLADGQRRRRLSVAVSTVVVIRDDVAQQQVLRLDVPVRDVALVQRRKREQRLPQDAPDELITLCRQVKVAVCVM